MIIYTVLAKLGVVVVFNDKYCVKILTTIFNPLTHSWLLAAVLFSGVSPFSGYQAL